MVGNTLNYASIVFYKFFLEKLVEIRGTYKGWTSDDCSLVKLKDNVVKFEVEISIVTNCQDQNLFSLAAHVGGIP